ncbi:potassium channel family protein [Sinorhizobium sp. BG8]|uniref:potassium channel family protein n=1 Tax=Sinorhizobium sp. BG8 TaxID=2613773 RepID=UPI00193DBD00|nr:potassium channel family protein [Sinorhizobium sp. BG8]QRM53806.1 two pore domain potassium channel family protein [Sinorhizobium sp. BG8]
MAEARKSRRIFFAALLRQLYVLWPIFSGILVVMVGSGIVISRIENWRIGEALYFTFVTGLTIGYGDLTPKHAVARILALLIGFTGIVLTGIVAAVSVQALSEAGRNDGEQKR